MHPSLLLIAISKLLIKLDRSLYFVTLSVPVSLGLLRNMSNGNYLYLIVISLDGRGYQRDYFLRGSVQAIFRILMNDTYLNLIILKIF